MVIEGLRRFKLGRQWEDKCDGCTTGPLHYADVKYYGDYEKFSTESIAAFFSK